MSVKPFDLRGGVASRVWVTELMESDTGIVESMKLKTSRARRTQGEDLYQSMTGMASRAMLAQSALAQSL